MSVEGGALQHEILIVADTEAVLAEVRSALEDDETGITEVRAGEKVRAAVAGLEPDLVVSDMQVSSMGGVAVTHGLRLEESGGRLPHVPVLLLLDRRTHVFVARTCGAEGWIVKPLDARRLRRAADALLEGGTYHDESYAPAPLPADV